MISSRHVSPGSVSKFSRQRLIEKEDDTSPLLIHRPDRQIVNVQRSMRRPSKTKSGRSIQLYRATPFINNVFDNYEREGRTWERADGKGESWEGSFAFNSMSVMIQCSLTMNGGEDRTNTRREHRSGLTSLSYIGRLFLLRSRLSFGVFDNVRQEI